MGSRKIATICILNGLILILYPSVEDRVFQKKQAEVLKQWEDDKQITNQIDNLSTTAQPTSSTKKEIPVMIDGHEVVGVISIDNIDLQSPIINGSEEQSLKVGIGVVEPDRSPGNVNNYVLAGHNSATYGKHFNRLNELEVNDRIIIKTINSDYIYKVTSIFVVDQDNLSVLENSNLAEITLITCEYDRRKKPIYRLIVKGTLVT